MKISVYSDCHYYTPQEIRCIPTERVQVLAENAFSIGDNFDRKGCEPKDANKLIKEFEEHKRIFEGRWLSGNHEVLGDNVSLAFLVSNGVLFVHGDIFWGVEKANEFRKEQPYQGYSAVKRMLAFGRKIYGGHLSNAEAAEAAKLAKQFGCKVIIFGQTHVKKLQDKTVDGIRIINVPRGKTVIEV